MRKILYFIMCLPILFLSACDVHEWPETPEFVKCIFASIMKQI